MQGLKFSDHFCAVLGFLCTKKYGEMCQLLQLCIFFGTVNLEIMVDKKGKYCCTQTGVFQKEMVVLWKKKEKIGYNSLFHCSVFVFVVLLLLLLLFCCLYYTALHNYKENVLLLKVHCTGF